MPNFQTQYEALTRGAGMVDVGDRTQIELTGGDRASFLHNFCTADVKALAEGQGAEAFITNVKGKILGYVYVFCRADSLLLDTVPGQSEPLLAHLDRYLITEDVTLRDITQPCGELLVAGPQGADLLAGQLAAVVPANNLAHAACEIDGLPFNLRRIDITGPDCFLISAPLKAIDLLTEQLVAAGVVLCEYPAMESARIEAGTPYFGRDMSDDNLPQEVDRNERAISFTKGCYLGQETVARIDALGHVNRTLCGLQFCGAAVPDDGAALRGGGKQVGAVTSATWSPRLAAPLALGYVRSPHNQPGTHLDSDQGEVTVVRTPV